MNNIQRPRIFPSKIYKFGKNNEYILDECALRHIISGDYAVRPIKDSVGNRSTEDVISGGLHTWSGWEAFLTKHSDTVHLADFDSEVHKGWYFARELQNGVITLKIPRNLFNKDAAGNTMMPDTHYKSGYLWKTLYPKSYTEDDILQVIEEALLNIDTEESEISQTQSLIIGFARIMDPFTAIRIRIQLEKKQIRSAFPSWDQPYTGNNGKPYSHEHSISFHIAQSTIGITSLSRMRSCLIQNNRFSLDKLINLTPKFLMHRSRPTYGQIQDQWHVKRRKGIVTDAARFGEAELSEIQAYLHDFCISKEPFFLQSKIYEHYPYLIEKNSSFFNVATVMQNVCDCFYALMCVDNRRGDRHFLKSMQRFLSMGVIHAGGLNTLEFKRLIKLILDCALAHHASDSFQIFLESLSTSPIRSAMYSEFNVNTFVKKNNEQGLCVIGHSEVQMAFNEDHLIEFISLALGENYLLSFSKEDREKFARDLIISNYPKRLVKESMLYFKGDDFDFFSETLTNLGNITATRNVPREETLIIILREYCRMLVLYRQRVVMEDSKAYETDPFDYEYGSEEFFALTKQKHKRQYIVTMHELTLKSMIEYAQKLKYAKLDRKASYLLSVMTKERIPMPKYIPESVPSWMQEEKYRDQKHPG